MADYQAKINLLVSGQAQLKALTRRLKAASREADILNTRTQAIKAASRRTQQTLTATGREQPRDPKTGKFKKEVNRTQRLNALRQEREDQKALRTALFLNSRKVALQQKVVEGVNKELKGRRQINRVLINQATKDLELEKTTELFGTRAAKFERGTPLGTKSTQAEVDRLKTTGRGLQEAFAAAKKGGVENLKLLKTMADAMGKLVERQNELNRLAKVQTGGFERARGLQERIDDLQATGLVPKQPLQNLRKKTAAVISNAEVGNAVKYQKALNDAEAAVRRQEKAVIRVEKAQNSVAVAQKALNRLRSSEFAETKAVGDLQQKLDQAAKEAAKGNLVKAKQIVKTVRSELDAQADIVGELKKQDSKRKQIQRSADQAQQRADIKAEKEKRDTKRRQEKQKAQFGKRFTSIGTGVGFPLLFGGGPGSVLGGLIGGALGGIGGSVLLSALGQQFDRLGQAALNLGRAFQNVTANSESIARALGTGTPSGFVGQAEFLKSQGLSAQVGQSVSQEFEKVYGAEAARKFQELAKVSKEFDQVMSEIGVNLQELMVGPLGMLLKALKTVSGVGNRKPEDQQGDAGASLRFQEEADKDLPRIRELHNIKTRSFEQEQELNKLETDRVLNLAIVRTYNSEITDDLGEQVKLSRIAKDLLESRKNIQLTQTNAVEQELTARRDNLAVLNTLSEILSLEQQELNIENELTAERKNGNIQTARFLDLENQLIGVQGNLARARLGQNNALIKAQRAIAREEFSNFQAAFQARQNILTVDRQIKKIREGFVENYIETNKFIEQEKNLNIILLEARKEQELIGKNELEVINSIVGKYTELVALEKFRAKLRIEQNRQNELFRKDANKEFANRLNFENKRAQIEANQQIRAASPNRVEEFLGSGFGFFDQSVQLENELMTQRAEQTQLYAIQITDLAERIKELQKLEADPKRINALQKEQDQIRQTADAYSKFQPQIDAARVQQQRFNDALSLVSPITKSLINNISEVVQGTKSAQEAFADFLRTIGDTLVQEGTRMIATYIAIGIAKAFAGLAGGGSETTPPTTLPGSASQTGLGLNINGVDQGINPFGPGIKAAANGGPVEGGRPYMVGERGPELFIPGSSGGIMRNEDMRQMMGRSPAGVGAPQMNFTFETTNIGGTEFVSREQLEVAMSTTRRQAASDGAKQGMSMTLDKMQNSPRTRSRVGIR